MWLNCKKKSLVHYKSTARVTVLTSLTQLLSLIGVNPNGGVCVSVIQGFHFWQTNSAEVRVSGNCETKSTMWRTKRGRRCHGRQRFWHWWWPCKTEIVIEYSSLLKGQRGIWRGWCNQDADNSTASHSCRKSNRESSETQNFPLCHSSFYVWQY